MTGEGVLGAKPVDAGGLADDLGRGDGAAVRDRDDRWMPLVSTPPNPGQPIASASQETTVRSIRAVPDPTSMRCRSG
jgi:hypothetical protein